MKNALLLFFCISLFACQPSIQPQISSLEIEKNEQAFLSALTKHLSAVSNRDLVTLEATLSPKGDMHLVLPQSKLMTTVKEFMDYHRAWFAEPNWTFETKIIHSDIVDDLGIAVVESLYKEPERDGKPYFNRMHITYALKKIEGKWYVIKDHASSVEKSIDN